MSNPQSLTFGGITYVFEHGTVRYQDAQQHHSVYLRDLTSVRTIDQTQKDEFSVNLYCHFNYEPSASLKIFATETRGKWDSEEIWRDKCNELTTQAESFEAALRIHRFSLHT
jgi:hypothetical protein